ncbi:MAG: CocE/NonD family hydrolase, partial [Terracidiphilus sp.]
MIRLRIALAVLCFVLLSAPPGSTQKAPQETKKAVVSASQLMYYVGEYINPDEPDTPLSVCYVEGRLFLESERRVPAELTSISETEFSLNGTKTIARFTLDYTKDSFGYGSSIVLSNEPQVVYRRTGVAIPHVFHDYKRTDAMIPMRDGVKLHTVILNPADITAPLPFLIQRTPYGVDGVNRTSFFSVRPELARDGYIFVAQDIRGRYKSEGEFIMSRPMVDHRDPKAVDESTDAYDTVAWLLKN